MHTSKISIICECEDTKTPLSRPITILNWVKEIWFDSSINDEYRFKLKEDLDGNIMKTIVKIKDLNISVLDQESNYISGIDKEEIDLILIK